MCLNSCRHSGFGRRGFTLIEVLAGLVLLGTLLAAATLAKSRFTRQLADADRRIEAVDAADQLLTGWWSDPQSLPRSGSGTAPGADGLIWQTRTATYAAHPAFEVAVTRLEIYDQRAQVGDAPIVAVDVLVPEAPAEEIPSDPDLEGNEA